MQPRKKIAIITPEYPPGYTGGTGVSAALLAKQLRKQRYKVDIFVFEKHGRCDVHDSCGNAYYFYGSRKSTLVLTIFMIPALWKRLDGYDVVHVFGERPLPAVVILKALKRTKSLVIASLNTVDAVTANPVRFFEQGRNKEGVFQMIGSCLFDTRFQYFPLGNIIKIIDTLIVRFVGRYADGYAALTSHIKMLHANVGYPAERIKVIPNMLDPDMPSLADGDKRSRGRRINLLFVGRLSREKGVVELMEAYTALPRETMQEARLTIVGTGPLESFVKDKISSLVKSACITQTHVPYDKVHEQYALGDVLVHPARWPEPFSRVRIEAQFYGLPVLSSDSPTAREVLDDSALFFNVSNKSQFTETLERVIEDNTLRVQLSVRSKYNVKRFRPDYILPHYTKLYRLNGS